MLNFWLIVISVVFGLFSVSLTTAAPQNPDLQNLQIVINLPGRTLELFADNQLLKQYPVAVGKPSTPTPTGFYSISDKERNPAWYPPESPGTVVPSGPHNPLGYRWLGFLPTYGVHGTNNAASIGSAISNGCIRMYESDVEELYEMVRLHTPLTIIYERVRAGIDRQNRAYIAIHPDIYDRQPLSVADVRAKLQLYEWSKWIDDSLIRQMLAAEHDKEYVFLPFYHLIVNGRVLADKVWVADGKLLLPLQAVAAAVNAKPVWDETNGQVHVGSRYAPVIKHDGFLYVAPASIELLFGGTQQLNQANRALEITIISLTLNGKAVAGDYPLCRETPLLPLLTVARALGQPAFWAENAPTATINNQIVPVQVIGGMPYIEINKVYSYFQAYVYWDEAAGMIDLTYPFYEPD